MNTVSDSLVEKIRKLLALSSNLNDSKEQSEAALAKAKELAIRHDIDLATIQVFEGKKSEEPIQKGEALNLGKRESISQKFITWILQNHFNVKVIYHGSRYSGKTLTLIGKKSDIEIATYVQGFLNQEFMRLWHDYREKSKVPLEHRNSYIYGLYQGLQEKLTQTKQKTETEAFGTVDSEKVEEVKQTYALVSVSQAERIEKALNEFYPRLRHSSINIGTVNKPDSISSGRTAGRAINICRSLGSGNGGRINA